MKKQTIIRVVAVAVFWALLLFNVGTTRCAPRADHLREAQSQVRKALPVMDKTYGQDLEEEKHLKFHLVEWLILQNLMKQYQELEVDPDLAVNSD